MFQRVSIDRDVKIQKLHQKDAKLGNHNESSRKRQYRPIVKRRSIRMSALVLAVIWLTFLSFEQELHSSSRKSMRSFPSDPSFTIPSPPPAIQAKKCAILLFGLPRAFRRLVLPSLKKHVIQPNAMYHCDYFIHWYSDSFEAASRSGMGGFLEDSTALAQVLQQTVLDIAHHSFSNQTSVTPKIQLVTDTNQTFWYKYDALMNRILTETGKRAFRKEHAVDPKLLYWPVKDKSYTAATLVNLVKMWHSIESVWKLSQGSSIVSPYDRMAVLRSDVMYLTPIDIWKRPYHNKTPMVYDIENNYAVVPGGFSMYPVNDRLIYGPAPAVQAWASKRLSLLEEHVHKTILEKEPGFGMHNERFLFHSIFPLLGNIEYDKTMCLVRVRADASVWINDCGDVNQNRKIIEQDLLGKPCKKDLEPLDPTIHTRVTQLLCGVGI